MKEKPLYSYSPQQCKLFTKHFFLANINGYSYWLVFEKDGLADVIYIDRVDEKCAPLHYLSIDNIEDPSYDNLHFIPSIAEELRYIEDYQQALRIAKKYLILE